ncbi:hypothetical protein ACFO0N_00880 [Halobium salinum]|uniref:DUF7511 domain-containing protein n=1 Tax=Halobium salinum TaxID=1364940 RepID=A0ABD5P742_9EURY|nr:hypothetical protein [Halobium salinum]
MSATDPSAPSTVRDGARSDDRTGRSFALHSVVVKYEDGPDRCTIYRRADSRMDRTTRWLSADQEAFVDLADRC